jgi:universal stress protein A
MIDLQRILVPTDFSDHSHNALRYGVALAEKFGAELHLLHVIQDLAVYQPDSVTVGPPMAPPVAALTAAARVALQKLIEDHRLEDFHARADVLEGPPVEAIVDYAYEHNIDLIVIATHGRGWLAHFLLGSVAEKVVRKAPCPVMAVHLPEREFVKP